MFPVNPRNTALHTEACTYRFGACAIASRAVDADRSRRDGRLAACENDIIARTAICRRPAAPALQDQLWRRNDVQTDTIRVGTS